MANFDALGRAFKRWSGIKLLQTSSTGIATAAFFSNLNFSKLPKTSFVLGNYIKNFCPREYFSLSFHIYSED